jgi:DtxR family Mn-dependent transcriptional regulator
MKGSKRASSTGHDFSVHLENYVKAIWNLSRLKSDPRALVKNSELAQTLRVKRPTVTEMLNRLEADGWVEVLARQGVRLKPKGERFALSILRRHRLVEMFLSRALGLNATEAHDEAEVLEHAVSMSLCDHMDRFLGHPELDLQGMQIPRFSKSAENSVQDSHFTAADLKPGSRGVVASLPDYDSTAHRQLLAGGLKVGDTLTRLPEKKSRLFVYRTQRGKILSLSLTQSQAIRIA